MSVLLLTGVFILFICSCSGEQWNELKEFNETFKSYALTVENVIDTMERLVEKTRANSLQFLYDLDSSSFIRPPNEMKHGCMSVYQYLQSNVPVFKVEIIQLENQVLKKKIEIKERLNEISSQIYLYNILTDNEYRNCLIKGNETSCKQETSYWLSEKVMNLQCRVTNECEKVSSDHMIKKRSVCNENEFECNDGSCIEGSYVCDRNFDCNDRSDEYPGCSRYCFNGFHCRNSRCVEISQVCDGSDDCLDMSDEDGCPQPLYSAANCSLKTGQYLCMNRECVALAEVCNGRRDCTDGSDEGGKCGEHIPCVSDCVSGGGVCFTGPREAFCLSSCPQGLTEVEGQCLPGPQLPAASLARLIEGVPAVIARYFGAVGYLKGRLVAGLNDAFALCQPRQTIVSLGSPSNGSWITNLAPNP